MGLIEDSRALAGRRILIVEDEFLVALIVEDAITRMGATVVGPAARLAPALELARQEMLDAAILDVNVGGEMVWPVVRVLRARDVPFVVVTGYGRGLENEPALRGITRLDKPIDDAALRNALQRLLASRAPQTPAAFKPPRPTGRPS